MSNISRSEYQRVCELNKRLHKDIEILVGIGSAEKIQLIIKWREFFAKKDWLTNLLSNYAKALKND